MNATTTQLLSSG